MPRSERFSQRSKGSVFGKIIKASISEGQETLNAIDFIESAQGLGVKLYPVQRVIVKAIFGVPFDYKPIKVPMWDVFRENLLRTVSEAEFIHILYDQGRCNVDDWRDIPENGYRESCVFAGRRGGKALSVDEVIPAPGGYRRLGDIQEGDTVFSPNGKPVRVKAAYDPFWSKIYKVSFDDGTHTLAHSEHLWKTFTHLDRRNLRMPVIKTVTGMGSGSGGGNAIDRSKLTGRIFTTEQIKETLMHGKERNHTIPLSKAVEMPEAELILDPYCFGVWLGDGNKDCGIITQMPSDAEEIMPHFTKAGFAWKQNEKESKYWHVHKLPLRKLGVLFNKHIPEAYLWASAEQRLALLQGLMDTDGYCAVDGQCEFSNTNLNISEGVYHIAASLGLKPYWREGRATLYGKDCSPYYSVFWTATLPVFRLRRKLARLPKKVRDLQNYRAITAVEYAGENLVRCISVDNENGLFLFGKNFNVTHNSQGVSAVAGYALYKLLNIRSPQEFWGLVPGSPIDFTFLAQDDDGANRLFAKMKEDVNRSPFFKPYLRDLSNSSMKFVSESDRQKTDVTPTITIESYPCLEEHENVWTPSGLREIRDVEVGDFVLNQFGRPEEVTFKKYNREELLGVETSNFRRDPLLLTPKHTCIFVKKEEAIRALPYLIPDNRIVQGGVGFEGRKRGWPLKAPIQVSEAHAETLVAGDYLLFPRLSETARQLPKNFGNRQARQLYEAASKTGKKFWRNPPVPSRWVPEFPVTPETCRFFGLFVAEGSTTKDCGVVKWDFHRKEMETLAKFVCDTLASVFNLPSRIEVEGNGCRVVCCSVELGRGLSRLFGNGAKAKTFPSEMLSWPVERQRDFLRGYLEGDGNRDRAIAPTVSRKLAYGLYNLGIQAGWLPSVSYLPAYEDKHGDPHSESWYVEFCSQERYTRFFQEIEGQDYYWSSILNVRETGRKAKVVDIGVRTESFLTKLAAVHNCTTTAVRGPSSVFLAFDEFAHFRSAKGSTSDEVYAAATPATTQFSHRESDASGEMTDVIDRLILSISSPWKKVGKMYDLHTQSLKEGSASNIFTMRVSTAEMNFRIPSAVLRDEYNKNPLTWKAEFGGDFLESSETYVQEAQLKACVDCQWSEDRTVPVEGTARLNLTHWTPELLGRQYFWWVDLGLEHDATAVAISHLEHGGALGIRLVFDYIDRMMVGEEFTWPNWKNEEYLANKKYVGYRALPLEDVMMWLKHLNEVMPCFKGGTDQFGGQMLVQLLAINNISNVELIHLTPALNSQMAFALKGYIDKGSVSFPYVPKYIYEMKMVEAQYTNKYQVRVEAPAEKGAHDDMSDASQGSAFLALRWLQEDGGVLLDPTGQSLLLSQQMFKTPAPILSLNAVSPTELRVLERQRKVMIQQSLGGGPGVANPFHRRQMPGRGRGRR